MKIFGKTLLGAVLGAIAGAIIGLIAAMYSPILFCGCAIVECFVECDPTVMLDFACDSCSGEVSRKVNHTAVIIVCVCLGAVIGAIWALSGAIRKKKLETEQQEKLKIAQEAERKAQEAAQAAIAKAEQDLHDFNNHQMIVSELNQLLEHANRSKTNLDYGANDIRFEGKRKREETDAALRECREACRKLNQLAESVLADAKEDRGE